MPRQLPNLITLARIVLAIGLFVLLGWIGHERAVEAAALVGEAASRSASRERLLLNVCVVIFTLAALSDMADGQIARRWDLQTDFGRIVDPFADKVTVCGTFIMLAPLQGSQVASWMVVVILARELLVDGLRGFAESKGVAFPSQKSGKLKMVVQSFCLGWILLAMANFPQASWASWTTFVLIYATIGITVFSGLSYVFHARKVLQGDAIAAHTGDHAVPAAQTQQPEGVA